LLFIVLGGKALERKKMLFEAAFNHILPTCITDKKFNIIMANEAYWSVFGRAANKTKLLKCYEHRPGKSCHTKHCALMRVRSGENEYTCETTKENNENVRHFIVTTKPIFDATNNFWGSIECFLDITERKQLENEKEQLIKELQVSLDKVQVLKGFIPICAACKKIRDDAGFWSQVEIYISEHSNAKFSHSICPDCAQKLYPDFDLNKR
jgi:PAS domain S-box-containing protein